MNDILREIHDELLDGIIFREYQALRPQLTPNFKQDSIDLYRNDHYFKMKVDSLVSGIMYIVSKHVDKS